jgi:hypothetical protein
VASYFGRIQGRIFVAPWHRGSRASPFVARQGKGMLLFHLHLQPSPSRCASPPWSWPLLNRSMTYYFSITPTGRYSDVIATRRTRLGCCSAMPGHSPSSSTPFRRSRSCVSHSEPSPASSGGVVASSVLGLMLIGSVGFFVFSCPALTGLPFSYDAGMLGCSLRTAEAGSSLDLARWHRTLGPGPPPQGWCWI